MGSTKQDIIKFIIECVEDRVASSSMDDLWFRRMNNFVVGGNNDIVIIARVEGKDIYIETSFDGSEL
jgi:hypothetical protein